jgi:hypothetical protein
MMATKKKAAVIRGANAASGVNPRPPGEQEITEEIYAQIRAALQELAAAH